MLNADSLRSAETRPLRGDASGRPPAPKPPPMPPPLPNTAAAWPRGLMAPWERTRSDGCPGAPRTAAAAPPAAAAPLAPTVVGAGLALVTTLTGDRRSSGCNGRGGACMGMGAAAAGGGGAGGRAAACCWMSWSTEYRYASPCACSRFRNSVKRLLAASRSSCVGGGSSARDGRRTPSTAAQGIVTSICRHRVHERSATPQQPERPSAAIPAYSRLGRECAAVNRTMPRLSKHGKPRVAVRQQNNETPRRFFAERGRGSRERRRPA